LFLLKLISKKLSRKEGKDMARGKTETQGENIDTEGKNIFPQYTACESRTTIAWPRREKIKTQGEKYHIFSPN
jgi:hypothetical protein